MIQYITMIIGFDPKNQEIVDLIRDLGKGDTDYDQTSIDFQEFLEIMIQKMSQPDTVDDIDKAFNLFVDGDKNQITFNSLKKVVKELGEDLTD